MATSEQRSGPTIAAAGNDRPGWGAGLRPLVLALGPLLGLALLAGCAARPPVVPPPPAPPGWQAAIGSLDVTGSPEVCTAVLVRPDLIATTSHCLRPRGRFAPASQLVFTSSLLPGVSARGAALVAEGGSVAPGSIKPDQAQTDWALVRIAPPITSIRPLPLAPLSPAMVRAELARGAHFYSAGYGQGAKTELRPHNGCGPLPPDPNGVTEGEYFFATNCVIRLGDSGGPVVLIQDGEPKLIGLIVGFANEPKNGETIGIVVSARAFAPYLGADLISRLAEPDGASESSIN